MTREALDELIARLAAGAGAAQLEAAGAQVDQRDLSTVRVVFPPGQGPAIRDLEAWFGPFGEPPRSTSGRRRLRWEHWREPMPVRVALYVIDPPAEDEPLSGLLLQRGTSRP